ncbi:MAG: sulfite exporter TauE/SafE family protein [Firmicutes bacterium]|nr:sulfite exporter TauE/SafE family protein [Bacillota bacterium]
MTKKRCAAVIGLAAGICNGLFGSGGGTIAVPCMEKFMSARAHKAHATAVALILPLSLISGIIYLYGGIPLREIVLACAGGAAGGYIGARLLKKIKVPTLHKIFGVFMLVGGIRMII